MKKQNNIETAKTFVQECHVHGLVNAIDGGVIYLESLLVDYVKSLGAQEKLYTEKEVEDLILQIVKEISYGNEDLLLHFGNDFKYAKEWFNSKKK